MKLIYLKFWIFVACGYFLNSILFLHVNLLSSSSCVLPTTFYSVSLHYQVKVLLKFSFLKKNSLFQVFKELPSFLDHWNLEEIIMKYLFIDIFLIQYLLNRFTEIFHSL